MDTHDAPTTGPDPVDEALGLMRRIADCVDGDGSPADGQQQVEAG